MEQPPRQRALGLSLALAAALFFAIGIIFSKELTDGDLPVPLILGIRFSIAAVIILAVAASQRQLAVTRRQFFSLILLGAIGYGGEAGLYFLGLERGSATAVTLIFYAYPALVAAGSVALGRERLAASAVAALLVVSAGIALLVLPGGGVELTTAGFLFALGAAVVFTGYLLVGEQMLAGVPALTGAAMTVTGSALFHLLISAGGGLVEMPEGDDLIYLPAVAVCTAAAFIGLIGGLRQLGATEAGLILTIEPVAAAGLAAVFLDELLSPLQLVGGALVISGVAYRAFSRGAAQPADEVVPLEGAP